MAKLPRDHSLCLGANNVVLDSITVGLHYMQTEFHQPVIIVLKVTCPTVIADVGIDVVSAQVCFDCVDEMLRAVPLRIQSFEPQGVWGHVT